MTSQVELLLTLELKYCEQCGGLWLRPRGSKQCYCDSCVRFLEDMPPRPRDNRRRGGSGPLRRQMRKQFREPGTELAPLQYVLAKEQEREREQKEPWTAAGAELTLAGQEAGVYEGQ